MTTSEVDRGPASGAGCAARPDRAAASGGRRRGRGRGGTWRGCWAGSSARTAGSWPRTLGSGTRRGCSACWTRRDWDADAVRDDLRAYVVEHLGDPAGGAGRRRDRLPEEGDQVGRGAAPVQRHGRAASRTARSGVFLAYASAAGRAFLDRALYLPKSWAEDARAAAGSGGAGGGRLRDQAAAGPGDAGAGLRRRGAGGLGDRRRRSTATDGGVPPLAGGRGACPTCWPCPARTGSGTPARQAAGRRGSSRRSAAGGVGAPVGGGGEPGRALVRLGLPAGLPDASRPGDGALAAGAAQRERPDRAGLLPRVRPGRRRPWRRWSASPGGGGRSRRASSRPRARWGWTSTRCAVDGLAPPRHPRPAGPCLPGSHAGATPTRAKRGR